MPMLARTDGKDKMPKLIVSAIMMAAACHQVIVLYLTSESVSSPKGSPLSYLLLRRCSSYCGRLSARPFSMSAGWCRPFGALSTEGLYPATSLESLYSSSMFAMGRKADQFMRLKAWCVGLVRLGPDQCKQD